MPPVPPKPYGKPQITDLGEVSQLTQGGIVVHISAGGAV